MSEFNFKSAICTSREQSERLLALGLKKETADMYISNGVICARPYSEVIEFMRGIPIREEIIPAWSLHRLLCLYGLDFTIMELFNKDGETYDDLISKIEEAIKEGYFNKEYLV